MRIDPTIKGKVLDVAGNPIQGVKVFPSTVDGKGLPGIDVFGTTDASGNYTFSMPIKHTDPTASAPISQHITAEAEVGYQKTTKQVSEAQNSTIVLAKPGEEEVVNQKIDQSVSADQTKQAPNKERRRMIIGLVLISLSLVAFYMLFKLVRKE